MELFSEIYVRTLKVTQDKKIVNFDPNWAFPDCNSTLNLLMAAK